MNTDIYTTVTDRIVAALELGVAPWVKPWHTEAEPFPVNAGSRRPYRGINVLLLAIESMTRGYAGNAWLTYRQATELGAQVRNGEHGTHIVFYKQHEVPNAEHPDDKAKVVPILRTFTVFNTAQIDNLPANLTQPAAVQDWVPIEEAERLMSSTSARIQHGSSKAFYRPDDDCIQLPEPGAFHDRGSYYATALHELTHWTGHPTRCNRQLRNRFGDAAYAVEELVAEIGSAFLCAHCRIDGQLQHPSYIANWLEVLKNDKRCIFTAAAKAQQAADYIHAFGSEEVRRTA